MKKIMSKVTNGGKPSMFAILTAISVLLVVIVNYTKVFDRIFDKGAGSALLAQAVSDNTDDIAEVSIEVEEVADVVNEDGIGHYRSGVVRGDSNVVGEPDESHQRLSGWPEEPPEG